MRVEPTLNVVASVKY